MKRNSLISLVLLVALMVFAFAFSVYAQATVKPYCIPIYVSPLTSKEGSQNPQEQVEAALELIGEKIDPIERGAGPYHTDEFAITVKMPLDVSAEEFLFRMAVDLNGFLNDPIFNTYMIQTPQRAIDAAPQVGDVYKVDLGFVWRPFETIIPLLNPEDAQVMLTELTSDHYTFTTITDKDDLFKNHPTPGMRTWGFEKLDVGIVRFYTKGYSRVGKHLVDLAETVLVAAGPAPGEPGYPLDPDELRREATAMAVDLVHKKQQEAWELLMEAIGYKVVELGGEVRGNIASAVSTSNRPSDCTYYTSEESYATWDYSGINDPLNWNPSD